MLSNRYELTEYAPQHYSYPDRKLRHREVNLLEEVTAGISCSKVQNGWLQTAEARNRDGSPYRLGTSWKEGLEGQVENHPKELGSPWALFVPTLPSSPKLYQGGALMLVEVKLCLQYNFVFAWRQRVSSKLQISLKVGFHLLSACKYPYIL
jgi:hypothetical protein